MSELNSTASVAAHHVFDTSIDKTSDALRPVLDQLMTGVHEAVARLAEVAEQAVAKVEDSGDYLKESQTRMVSGCRSYVRDKPLTSIGVALASGFLLSLALRQR
jgi:ElaB/YqjD/DUF883 family membrane-anchored ribosome-binding protein